jgi:hypothetical protein
LVGLEPDPPRPRADRGNRSLGGPRPCPPAWVSLAGNAVRRPFRHANPARRAWPNRACCPPASATNLQAGNSPSPFSPRCRRLGSC